jgi:hypothetical protein
MRVQYLVHPPGCRSPRHAVGFKTVGALPSIAPGTHIVAAPGTRWRVTDVETVLTHRDEGHVTDAVVKVFCAPADRPAIFDNPSN